MSSQHRPSPSGGQSSGSVLPEQYTAVTGIDTAREYLSLLQRMEESQNNRLQAIESKIAQLIAQSSIVISIASLFIPLLSDKFRTSPIIVSVIAVLVFGGILGVYLHSIYKACETLLIYKFRFSRQGLSSVTKADRETNVLNFINSQNADLVYIIRNNEQIINEKGTSLIKAAKSFRIGSILLGGFTIAVSLFLIGEKEPEKDVHQIINLQVDEAALKHLQSRYFQSSAGLHQQRVSKPSDSLPLGQ